MKGIRRAWAAVWLFAAVIAAVPATDAAHAEGPPTEACAVLKETKIQGKDCKALILNGCSHEVELNIHYEVALRQIVILPVQAEGPAYEYRDGGTVKADEKAALAPGESRWFTHTSRPPEVSSVVGAEKVQIEVARCKVGFDYFYQPK